MSAALLMQRLPQSLAALKCSSLKPALSLFSGRGSLLLKLPFKGNSIKLDQRFTRRNFTKPSESEPPIRHESLPNRPSAGGSSGLILRSALFTAGFGTACFTGAVIANYELRKSRSEQKGWPSFKTGQFRNDLNDFWNNLSPVKKLVVGIIFLNTMVMIAWRLPAMQPILERNFLLFGESKNLTQLLGSVFSHHGIFHLGFNMVALYTISDLLGNVFKPEQFLAFYLTSGVFASFCARAAKIVRRVPSPSLGASGAVISCFALSAILYPTTTFYVFPIPFPLEAHVVLKILVAFDIIGLTVFRRLKLDHAAHLGGVLFAYSFYKLGPTHVADFQSMVNKKWHKIRSN